jgi:SAM-dependent methyltransferase
MSAATQPGAHPIDVAAESPRANLERLMADGLQHNCLDPGLLYATPRQAELWRRVHAQHSPFHANPEFIRIYRKAFSATAAIAPADPLLVGLGAGTGQKECDLFLALRAHGKRATFCAVDISRDLVEEAARRLISAGADHRRSLVCDLAEGPSVRAWLDALDPRPRLITFFGVVPNLRPAQIAPLFHSLLRPGDRLLVSAHLAPVEAATDLTAAMQRVLPQYDNAATLAWLAGALEAWNLGAHFDSPRMTAGSTDGVPAFVGVAEWKLGTSFSFAGQFFHAPANGAPLQLFQSLRYTPQLFEDELRRAGLLTELLAITACREEAIWAVRLPSK